MERNFKCLPGRLAVLVEDEDFGSGEVLVPAAIRARWLQMERPPYRLLRGTVVAVGALRGRVALPAVGSEVWVLPKPGLIIRPGDVDLPALGRLVPAGHTLRFYGVGDDWHEAVLGTT